MDAGSSYFDISVDLVYGKYGYSNYRAWEYFSFGQQSNLLEYSKRMSKKAEHILTYFLRDRKNLSYCYFWIRGEYRRIDGSGIFKVEELFYYDLKNKKGGVMEDKYRSEIIAAVRTNKQM